MKKKKNICNSAYTFLAFFFKILLVFLNRCKTIEDKLVFSPRKTSSWTNPSENLRAFRWLCNKNSKKLENCVGFSTSRSERVNHFTVLMLWNSGMYFIMKASSVTYYWIVEGILVKANTGMRGEEFYFVSPRAVNISWACFVLDISFSQQLSPLQPLFLQKKLLST